MAGYCGLLLRINLSTGEVEKENLDLEIAKKFIGGRGLAMVRLEVRIHHF